MLLDLLNCGVVRPKDTVVLSGHMYCGVNRPPVLSFCQATGTVMLTEHLYFSVARPYFTLVMSGLPLSKWYCSVGCPHVTVRLLGKMYYIDVFHMY